MVRIVCKLNIFLIIVAMFIGVSANADDNTQHVWKYTPIATEYDNTGLVELTESDENFNTYTVTQTTTSPSRCLYVRTENPLPANHKYFVNIKFKSNFAAPYFRFAIDGDYANIRDNDAYKPNEWLNLYKILTPTQDLQFTGTTNGIMSYANKYVAGETITIDKNGFLTMFDLTKIFGAGNEPTTVAAAIQALSIDTTIKIATTKYSKAQFAPVENDLNDAVAAVDTVVTQTMTQAQAIDQIATSKQTRPDETCPVGKNCLLVEDEQGVPHWYVIAGADEANPTNP